MNQWSLINVEALGWQPFWFSRWPPFKHIYFDIVSNCRERTIQIKIRPCEIDKWYIGSWGTEFFRTHFLCTHPSVCHLGFQNGHLPKNLVFSIFVKLRGIGSSFQWQNKYFEPMQSNKCWSIGMAAILIFKMADIEACLFWYSEQW